MAPATPNVRGLLAEGGLRSVFQPIVDLHAGALLGSEPSRAHGCLAEREAACGAQAFRSAVAGGLLAPLTVFVNVEPEILGTAPRTELLEIARAAPGELRVVFEITERAI